MKRLGELVTRMAGDISKVPTPTTSSTSGPAEPECPLCHGLGWLREDVPVGHPSFGKLFPCHCKLAEIEQQRRERLRAASQTELTAHMTFDSFVTEREGLPAHKIASLRDAYDQAYQFSENPQGWLILLGGYGCGKTHLAAAIANRLVERGHLVLFVVVPDLLDYLRATFGPQSPARYEDRFEEVRNAPILILDDLGTQSTTPWAQEKLFQIVNYRYTARLPTIITSNLTLEDIDVRIRSRLVDPSLGRLVPIVAPDFRQSGVGQDHSDLSSLPLLGDMTFDEFDLREDELPADQRENLARAFELCEDFSEQPEGWLVLTGPFGCGKTHLAAAIANARVAAGYSALFIVVPDLLDHLRATFSPTSPVRFDRRFEEIKNAPLLVLDDLGTESASPWAQEKLYQLFNYRYITRLPTVITSTRTLEQMDERLRTRMLDVGRCTVFGIVAPSYRGSPKRRKRGKGRGKGARARG